MIRHTVAPLGISTERRVEVVREDFSRRENFVATLLNLRDIKFAADKRELFLSEKPDDRVRV